MKGDNEGYKIPNYKHQNTNKHQVPSTKIQRGLEFGYCDLEFIWSLMLGIWSLPRFIGTILNRSCFFTKARNNPLTLAQLYSGYLRLFAGCRTPHLFYRVGILQLRG